MATKMTVATNTEFEKLLADAPLARDADSVTVVGTLARTADPAHFSLTLTDGRTLKLSVGAVKSSKVLAGAIGQSIVELELDVKLVPEDFRELIISSGPNGPTIAFNEYTVIEGSGTGAGDVARKPPHTDKPPHTETLVEVLGLPFQYPVTTVGAVLNATAPFVAATPHQAPQTTVDALRQALILKPLWADPNSAPAFEVTHPAAIYHLQRDYSY